MLLRDFVQSGRFDASVPESKTMFHTAEARGSVGACTEALRLPTPEGWERFGHESAVFWDTAVWEKVAGGIETIKTPLWHRGKSARRSVEITWVLLRHHRTGKTYLRLVGHLPAHLYRPAQRRANLVALRGLRAILLDLAEKYVPDHTGASFDFNRDLRFKRTRRLIAECLKGTGLRLVVPPKGTHLLRKIDGFLTDCPLAVAQMFPRFKGFDHRGFRVRTCFS